MEQIAVQYIYYSIIRIDMPLLICLTLASVIFTLFPNGPVNSGGMYMLLQSHCSEMLRVLYPKSVNMKFYHLGCLQLKAKQFNGAGI